MLCDDCWLNGGALGAPVRVFACQYSRARVLPPPLPSPRVRPGEFSR